MNLVLSINFSLSGMAFVISSPFLLILYKYKRFLQFCIIPPSRLLIISIFFLLKSVIFNACFLKVSQNFFMHSLPQYTSWSFSISFKDNIVNTEKLDGICLHTFVVDDFSRLFLHPSIFRIKD